MSELGNFATESIEGDTISFISWYRDGRLLTANPPFINLIGYSEEELNHMRWPDDFTSAESSKDITHAMNALDREGKPYVHDEEIIRKDGSHLPVEVFVHLYTPAQKQEQYYYSFITDISERKNAETELKDSKAQVELLLDIMSHDINNLNQVAMGFLELALEQLTLKDHERELVEKPLETLKSTSRFIDNIKKIQREKAGLYRAESVDLDNVLVETISHYSMIPGRDVKINYSHTTCVVIANELIKDVFQNLIGNAIKHSTGSLTIDIELSTLKEDNKRYCKISIEDNGPGISDTLKKGLLNNFCLESARARGKGLGVCLSKIIIGDLKGKFWIEDRVQGDHTKGARFVVMLPSAEN